MAIIGSGAGGGVAAEILSLAGLKVLLIEEGALRTSDSFRDMDELRSFKELYQEAAARTTSDGAIAVLQGRAVGGSTTVNWTSSLRTPAPTLRHWAEQHEVVGHGVDDMKPWFERMEQRLHVMLWEAPNANNHVLKRGCDKLGWEAHAIARNVTGCWNSGFCGFGCRVNAKQSMLVSTIPTALQNGATLVHRVRVRQLQHADGRVGSALGEALRADGLTPSGVTLTIKARHYIAAGGAINTPAMLLRSAAPDPHEQLGRRTLIHPVVLTLAEMPERIDPFYGAPQSIASDHFQWKDGATGADGLQARGAADLPRHRRRRAQRLRQGLAAGDGRAAARQCRAGAAARRLRRTKPRRARPTGRRRQPDARLRPERLCLGRRAAVPT